MVEVVKNLGQLMPQANTLTGIYTVPAGKSAVLSSILVCNQGSDSTSFRISHALGGGTDEVKQYLYFDEIIPSKKAFAITLGLTLSAGDVLRVQSANGNVSFNLYGSELS